MNRYDRHKEVVTNHQGAKDIKGTSVILEGQHVSIGYRQKKHDILVHRDLNFRLYQGELTCLLGANGSGKSTLLRTLSAVQPSLSGDIFLLDKPLNRYAERERSRTIGVVLTERTQTGGLTVWELVALGRQPHTGFFGRLNATDKGLIDYAIEAVGISRLAHSYMAELSDGERQKAFIAKALVQECPLILLDEPTAFLDVVSRIEIMTLLRRLAKEEQKAILLSTHDIDQALLLADRLWLLRSHEGITCGVTEDLILDNQLDTLFPESEICFNNQNGIFAPRTAYTKAVTLYAADERLRHWTVNALHRMGYECLMDEAVTSETVAKEAAVMKETTLTEEATVEMKETAVETNKSHRVLPFLSVTSAHHLTLQTQNETHTFTSFEALNSYLNA